MKRMISLDHQEFLRECDLFDRNTFKSWEVLKEHFQTKWPAGSPGSAHTEHEYTYENNGDYPPDEPWVEYWVNNHTMQVIFNYFTTHKYWNFFEYIAWMGKYGCLYEYGNVTELREEIKRASRKRIPKNTKKVLREKAEITKDHKLKYFFNNRQYFVKHPNFGFLVTPDKTIIIEKSVIHLY